MLDQFTFLFMILIVVLACMPFVMFREILLRKRKRRLDSVSKIRFTLGVMAIVISLVFLITGMTILDIAQYYKEGVKTILEETPKLGIQQKADTLYSQGWAFTAVGIGLFFTGAQFIIDSFKK